MSIGGVILSHNHFDHAGGFRGALASGGDLIIGASSTGLYQELLERPYTLQDNPLMKRDGDVVLRPVDGKLVLGQGNEILEIYTVKQGHALEDDMLILYRPVDKALFVADLYNGGFENLGFLPSIVPTTVNRAQMLVDLTL